MVNSVLGLQMKTISAVVCVHQYLQTVHLSQADFNYM